MSEITNKISEALQEGDYDRVVELVKKSLDAQIPAGEVLSEGLLHGMNIVGEKFRNNEIYVPEVMIAARAMKAGTEYLKPFLMEGSSSKLGRICIGTVKGDLHDIGKNMVCMMLEGKGFEIIDLGVDVDAQAFIQAAIDHDCKIIACSALLTTTMPVMDEVVKIAEAKGIREKCKIMIGGAPVTQQYCDKIGADAYADDAATAAEKAVHLV